MLQTWKEEGKTPTEVAELLNRDLSSVARHFKNDGPASSKKAMKKVGRLLNAQTLQDIYLPLLKR